MKIWVRKGWKSSMLTIKWKVTVPLSCSPLAVFQWYTLYFIHSLSELQDNGMVSLISHHNPFICELETMQGEPKTTALIRRQETSFVCFLFVWFGKLSENAFLEWLRTVFKMLPYEPCSLSSHSESSSEPALSALCAPSPHCFFLFTVPADISGKIR